MIRSILAIMIIVFGVAGCGEPRGERIQRLVDDKLRIEQLRLVAECRKGLLDQAIAEVDSIIIERALRDTTNRMVRPTRPDVPNLEIPDIDTLGIKPLFEKEEIN